MADRTSTNQAIANLTLRFNQFLENARKVNELDPQTLLNPDSKLHVMIDGASQYLTVQQILDAFISSLYKELLSVGNIELVDEDITLTDIVWKINDTQYTESHSETIPLALTGNIRNDIFVGYDNGEIERIAGFESDSIATTPPTPSNAVLITQVIVTDSNIGEPTEPTPGNIYFEKEYFSTQVYNGSGVINTLNLDSKRGGVSVQGSVTQLGGFQRNTANYVLGAPFYVYNNTDGDLELVNLNASSNLKMIFPDNENFILKKNQVAFFVEESIGGIRYKKFVASSSYIPKASQTVRGGVKTSTNELDPLVYTYNEVDALLAFLESTKQDNLGFTPEDLAKKNLANGYAGLDANGKVPLSLINDALLGNLKWYGIYDGTEISDSPTPILNGEPLPAPSVGNVGWYFIAEGSFTLSGTDYITGDWLISNGIDYVKVDNTDAVSSVAGLVGNVSVANLRAALVNVTQVSIQDESGTEQFKMTDLLKFKGVSFNVPEKRVDVDPLVGGVIFVSSAGNDGTAVAENRSKPYLTLNAAITAYWANPNIDYIEIISAGAFTINQALNNGTTRKFDLRSQKNCTITVSTVVEFHINNQEVKYDIPFGSLIFSPTTNGGGFSNAIVNITTNILTFNATYKATNGNGNPVVIITNTLNINSMNTGIITGSGGKRSLKITANTINFRGAGCVLSGLFIYTDINFDKITHDNTFSLNSLNSTVTNINHGSISSVSPYVNTTVITYLKGGNTTINYKTGATISSNLSIDMFNVVGNLKISGNVDYINSDVLIIRHNQAANNVEFSNAVVSCKNLIGGDRIISKFIFTNSTINLTGTHFADCILYGGGGQTYQPNQFTFIGTNYILGVVDGFNLIKTEPASFVQLNTPSVNLTKGEIKTNGKFDRETITITEFPLNQYYDTTQRQLVIVNEKEEIINQTLNPTKTYMIDGIIELSAGEFIEIDSVTISGYGFDVSRIKKDVSGESIFISPVGGSENLILKDITLDSGDGSVFNIEDSDGTHAIEMNDVNFENCSSLGLIKTYRQFTGSTVGIYGCSDGLQLSGNWNGFLMDKLHIRGFSTSGTIIKKDVDTEFSGRMSIQVNLAGGVGTVLTDLDNTNFIKDETLQFHDCIFEMGGAIDSANTAVLIPNITANDPKSRWTNCLGITNSDLKPYGFNTVNLPVYADDTAAASGGIEIGEVYIESSTGYFKTRLT